MESKKKEEMLSSFTHQDFASVLKKYKYQLNIGDITAGTIFSREKQGCLVDIGEHKAAYLPEDEISLNAQRNTEPLMNSSREFFILAYNKKVKQLILSIKRLDYMRGWQRIKQIKTEDATIYTYIHRLNKGGVITSIEGIQGFIPNSHIAKIRKKNKIIGQQIECKILFINEKTNTVVLSNKRAALNKLLPKIYVGKIVTGIISKIQDYGAFISIYGFLALLHVSEIDEKDFDRIKDLNIGSNLAVKVIHIDTKQGRLSVSRKCLG